MKLTKTLVLLVMAMCLALPYQAAAQSTTSSPEDLIEAVNDLRAENDLPPYEVNSVLMIIAQNHAEYIAGTGVVTHFSEDGSRPYQRAIKGGYQVSGDLTFGGLFSEAIDSGSGLTPAEAVEGWQDTPADLKTLLSPDFEDIGVGIAAENGMTYFVLDVGTASGVTPVGSGTAAVRPTSPGTPGTEMAPVITSTALDDGTVYHVVQSNEALWSIALAYGLTIEELKQLNRLASDEIFIGQKLLISQVDPATPTPEITITATFGIPTSEATRPPTPTKTLTSTPVPIAPESRQNGVRIVGGIVLVALVGAGLGMWLGRKKPQRESDTTE